jgi:2-methylcitrate dehydratase PrpD
VIEKHVPSALGSTERPMSDRDLESKYRALVDCVLPAERADALMRACWSAEQCEDAAVISRRIGAA